jgi:hypothetical protein
MARQPPLKQTAFSEPLSGKMVNPIIFKFDGEQVAVMIRLAQYVNDCPA